MAISVINQKRDVEIVVMNRGNDKPSLLVLNSARVVNAASLAGAKNLIGLTANLTRAFHAADDKSILLAADLLSAGKVSSVAEIKAAHGVIRSLSVQLNALFAVAFRASNQSGMIDIATSGAATCFAYVIDHAFGVNAPHMLCPTGVHSGFFPAGVATRMNALPGLMVADASVPHQFMVYGKR
jgi:hypothetical protein